jgi:hypothetical protein
MPEIKSILEGMEILSIFIALLKSANWWGDTPFASSLSDLGNPPGDGAGEAHRGEDPETRCPASRVIHQPAEKQRTQKHPGVLADLNHGHGHTAEPFIGGSLHCAGKHAGRDKTADGSYGNNQEEESACSGAIAEG